MLDLINEKIDELIKLTEIVSDKNTLIVLLILQGARHSGDDDLLARYVSDFTDSVLLPRLKEKIKNKLE